jgi:hypothetical protein
MESVMKQHEEMTPEQKLAALMDAVRQKYSSSPASIRLKGRGDDMGGVCANHIKLFITRIQFQVFMLSRSVF